MKKIVLLFVVLLAASVKQYSISASSESSGTITHEIWDALLKKNVASDGNVNYKGFIKDSLELNKYLNLLSLNTPDSKWTTDEQKAYWINSYNAFTIRLIIRHYPIKSINDITSRLKIPNLKNPWDYKFIKIGKQLYSLNTIEHKILRPKFNDPRIHFAIVCASASCPKLRNEAYVASKLNSQLGDQAVLFINDTSKNKITPDNPQLSEIFNWFKEDFTKNSTLINFINKYSKVKMNANASISYLSYDWTLNEF